MRKTPTPPHFTDDENRLLRDALERLREQLQRERGTAKRVSDEDVGEAIGVSQVAVQKYVKRGGGFSRRAAQALADKLQTSLSSILGEPGQVINYENIPDPELRLVLEYRLQFPDHGWSQRAIGAAIGLALEGERHTRVEWEQLLASLTAQLRKR